MRLVLATRNAHKAREFATLLAPHEILALPDDVELPPETGDTFEANAREKALAAARATGLTAIADDSGIEAAALGGRPGVRSARFAGEDASDEENLAKLLREAPAGSPLAYVCALVLADARRERSGTPSRGAAPAPSPPNPRGDGGFGYDPAFVPDDVGDGRTMAELAPARRTRSATAAARRARCWRCWRTDGRPAARRERRAGQPSRPARRRCRSSRTRSSSCSSSPPPRSPDRWRSSRRRCTRRSTSSRRSSRSCRCARPTSRPTPTTPTATTSSRTSRPRSRRCSSSSAPASSSSSPSAGCPAAPRSTRSGSASRVIAFSVLANVVVSTVLARRARETDSPALEGDAAHLRTDAATSAAVLVGLVVVELTGAAWLDPVIALAVAAAIVYAGIKLLLRASRVLVDEALPPAELDAVRAAIAEFGPLGVCGYHKLRARRAGSRRYVDLHVQFVSGTTLEAAHETAHRLQDAIRRARARRRRPHPPRARGERAPRHRGARGLSPASGALSAG